ncbi:GNAT family N-acetyltransferase [Hyphomicrobium sulfonivorans]|uniref:GNAT family N-acetyltransferase n=1 Tax=Hyphomicrobium sulfonivorans TaxID=121290 RepID=UPI00156D7A47|nr:GNAT family N-acetyltransferase [Hyphomicrobium sulfonivorans]MBI1650053.1 N-acetyltransferase [Hyphomicrobium sulfonivorans]NSL72971.1 GNAT family N-acetyltransferase [Hyphomicrobium sulfonivorans]
MDNERHDNGVEQESLPEGAEAPAKSSVVANIVARIADVDAEAWDACANPDAATFNPFVSHRFLKALEESGCVGPQRTGWLPQHILIADGAGRDDSGGADGSNDRDGDGGGNIVACAPCYVKLHSAGEYVFDHSWAAAYEQAGGSYYPKLQIAVPFTPVPGPRLLVRPGPDADRHRQTLAAAAAELARRMEASSVHVTFLPENEWRTLGELGLLQRTGQQFHWRNDGYRTFDDFMASLASRKRKALRKERSEALANGITVEHLSGADITEEHWDAFFRFYIDTGSRKWGTPYLNRRFFSLLGEAMAEHCLLVMAKRDGEYIAGALNLIGGDCLYGRYWGAIEHHPFLHFELCYYQAIDYAIAHGLKRVEAGAQGEHKLARGYMPVTTYSAHLIADPGLRRGIARYLKSEREAVAEDSALLAELGPYRKGNAPPDE